MTGSTRATQPLLVTVVFRVAGHAVFTGVFKARRFVTLDARRLYVCAYEREARLPMVEAHIFFPSRLAVALLALVALLASMRIVASVTGHACHIELHLARGLHVTRRTGLARMGATQRKARLACVIEASLPPITLVVAILAGHTVAPLVRTRVFVTMAREALGWQAHLARRLNVTRAALDSAMTPAKWKPGAGVIKPCRTPPDRAVTFSAIRAQTAAMRIIRLVAVHATRRRSVVALAGVTGHAARRQMRALQRKARVGVIKADLLPIFVGMTTAATNTQSTSVWLVRAVAIYARA